MRVQGWDPAVAETSGGVLVGVQLAAPGSLLRVAAPQPSAGSRAGSREALEEASWPSCKEGRPAVREAVEGSAEPLGPTSQAPGRAQGPMEAAEAPMAPLQVSGWPLRPPGPPATQSQGPTKRTLLSWVSSFPLTVALSLRATKRGDSPSALNPREG